MVKNYISRKSKIRREERERKNKIIKRTSIIVLSVIVFFVITFLLIVLPGHYKANEVGLKGLESDDVVVIVQNDKTIEFVPKLYDKGFIFYPGGKVEAEAYAPLLKRLASMGVLCVAVKPAFDLACFNENVADDIIEEYSNLEWFIGGHSFGGVIASHYASKNENKISGVALLASYSKSNLRNSYVISIYGSNDEVLNMNNYEKNKKNLPDSFEEYVIDGGCHAYFGNYGEQKGDGEASISVASQQVQTVNYLYNWMKK